MALFKKKNDGAALNSVLVRRPIQKCFPIFLLPTFIAFCIGFLYPFGKGLFLSFCNFKTTSKWTWAGLDNYVKAFADESFLHAFWYTAGFALVSLLIINILAFTVAYLLTKSIKGSNIFRTVFFMPNLIGGIVLGYIWSMIFDGILRNYATYLTAFRNVIVKYSPVTTMKWMFLFAAVVAAAVYYRPLTAVDYAALAPRTWAGIGYVVVCSTFLSYFMVPIGQRYLRPTVVSMYNYVQPVVAVLFSVAIGLDSFGFTKAAAALCVFAGVWLVTKSKSRAQVEAEAGMKKG